MSFGFNSEIRVGAEVCHVQTEEHGPTRAQIDTVVYIDGRVVHRRTSSYQELFASAEFTQEALRKQVEEHHRGVIEALRAGSIVILPAAGVPPPVKSPASPGIQVQLLNPASWLAGGTATLEIEVLSRAGRGLLRGAQVEVILEGSQGPLRFVGKSDERGRAILSFPMPHFGPGGAALVIRAAADSGQDEIRYALRSKKTAAP